MPETNFLDVDQALNNLKLPAIPAETLGGQEIKFTQGDKETTQETIEETDSFEATIQKQLEAANKDNKTVQQDLDNPNPEETEDQVSQDEQPNPDEYSPVKGISEWARTTGILDFKDEEFEDKEEWLKTKLVLQQEDGIKKGIEAYKAELPEAIKDLADKYEDGVPFDEYLSSKSREQSYSTIKEESLKGEKANKELQKKLVQEWLSIQEYTPEEASEQVQEFDDAGLLEKQSLIAHKKLNQYEVEYQKTLVKQTQERKVQEQKQHQDWLKNIQDTTLGSEEIIPEIKLSKEERQRIYDAYTKGDPKTRETQLVKAINSDPKAWLKITQFMVLYEGKLDKVKEALKTQVSKDLKQKVTSYKEPVSSSLGKINMKKVAQWAKENRI